MSTKRSDYAYDLDESLIAASPLPERSGARLMHLPADAPAPSHMTIKDLPRLLRPGDLMVVNNTAVVPARLHARKSSGGVVEILVVEWQPDGTALTMAQASKPLRPATVLSLPDGDGVEVGQRREDGLWQMRFSRDVPSVLQDHGEVPLPPYIRRAPLPADSERYQTVFARHPGSSAAPTAGLHLDGPLLAQLASKGIEVAELTLHVGPGTFVPVRADDLRDHVMHEEQFHVPESVAAAVKDTRTRGGRVVAVGTTSARTLESAADEHGLIRAGVGRTRLFIHPPHRFKVVDVLLTNFHLPESTLLMLVCALAGHQRVLAAYREAVRERYRFFSYGDAMLLERVDPV